MDTATSQSIEQRIAELEQSLAGWQQTALRAQQEIQQHAGAIVELRRLLTPAAPDAQPAAAPVDIGLD